MNQKNKDIAKKLLDIKEEEMKLIEEYINKFKNDDMKGCAIVKVYVPNMLDSEETLEGWDRLYLVNSIENKVVKLTDKQRELAKPSSVK